MKYNEFLSLFSENFGEGIVGIFDGVEILGDAIDICKQNPEPINIYTMQYHIKSLNYLLN